MFTEKHTGAAVLTAYIGISAVFFFRGYIQGDATFWMGILLIPFLLRSFPMGGKSWRLTPVVVLFIMICYFRQETSWRFLLLIMAMLLAAESIFGRLNAQFFAVLLIISPIFKYFSEVFTFPIRLQISAWAGSILQMAGMSATVAGNNIMLNGSEFSVDPPCMGLQTTGFALLSVIFLMGHFQMKEQKSLSILNQMGLIAMSFALNIAGNLIRIIILVTLKVLPDTAMHDFVGIICLLAYVVVPMIFIVRYAHRRLGGAVVKQEAFRTSKAAFLLPVHLPLLLVCAFFSFQKPVINIKFQPKTASPHPVSYASSQLKSGVTQFRSRNALVYVKPIPAFYSSEHSPATCWTGSGYHLSRISKKHVGGTVVYIGSLQKGKDQLHTAWWFSDGQSTTIGQLDWRWKCLTQKSAFKLINVTADDPALLDMEVKRWLRAI